MKKVIIGLSGIVILAFAVILFVNAQNSSKGVTKAATEVSKDCAKCPSASTCNKMGVTTAAVCDTAKCKEGKCDMAKCKEGKCDMAKCKESKCDPSTCKAKSDGAKSEMKDCEPAKCQKTCPMKSL